MNDEQKQTHHEDAGLVGDTGAHGDLGTNAAGVQRPLPEPAAPAPPAPEVAIGNALVAAGYSADEAEALAEAAVDEIRARRAKRGLL